jgi:hypothetical protein
MNTVPVRSSVEIQVWLNGPVLGLSPPATEYQLARHRP